MNGVIISYFCCFQSEHSEDDGFGSVWPDQHKFGEVLAEFDQAKAWVHSVSWSPNGFRVAFTGNFSCVHEFHSFMLHILIRSFAPLHLIPLDPIYSHVSAGHGSTVHFAQILVGAPPTVQTVYHRNLPFRDVKFISNDALVAAGYDNIPTVFRNTGSESEPQW